MAAVSTNSTSEIPQWKKDLIARLRNQHKKSEERLWIDHHSAHHHHPIQSHHPHQRTDLVCPVSPENGFNKDSDSPNSSDSEDLHYGPGIVNRLRNKYLSLALRESNSRPTILRKATSLENLLDDDGGEEEDKEIRRFARRNGGNDGGGRYRSSSRRQEMKRARSVEVISRTSHEEELTLTSSVTAKINNRQSLHEDMLIQVNEEKPAIIESTKSYKKPVSIENGTEETSDKYTRRINRPKRIPPLLNEREKPPVDVVKHAKMIFEKRPETRTKKPQHTGQVAARVDCFNSMIVKTIASRTPRKTVKKPAPNGDVAAKVDSFNDIIVKTKVALKSTNKPTIKSTKPVLNDKIKSNTHHHVRPVAKPVILSPDDIIIKPKSLDIKSPRQERKTFNSLPSPIPDVSRVEIKNQDGSDSRNKMNSLCETPDLILTSSPLPKITSPTYRKRTTEIFLKEEINRSFLGHSEATNKYISPIHSPTKPVYTKPSSISFNKEMVDSTGFKLISPISQNNITKSSATSVFNFINSQVDQRHLPSTAITKTSPVTESNGFSGGSKIKMGLSAFEMEKNLKNSAKSNLEIREKKVEPVEVDVRPRIVDVSTSGFSEDVGSKENNADKSWQNMENSVEKTSSIFENLSQTGNSAIASEIAFEPSEETENVDKSKETKSEPRSENKVKPVQTNKGVVSTMEGSSSGEKQVNLVLPKKIKPRQEESTIAVFNFTSRKDVPDYIANDTNRTPSRPVIPKPDEPGIKLLPDALLANIKEFQEVWEEDELIRSLEERPPSPCDITFINDNVLINGKSSLIQRTSKRVKLKISFVDDPEIYDYPSETSLLLEECQPTTLGGTAQVGHNVPALSGSSLATYTPKAMEAFQLGITKSFQEPAITSKHETESTSEHQQETDVILEEIDQPVLFSSGSTSDILF